MDVLEIPNSGKKLIAGASDIEHLPTLIMRLR
jgi:hypothetical protein